MNRRFLGALLASVALGLASGAALAVEDIYLANGQVKRGEILEVKEDGIRAKGRPKGGGTAELFISADRLDPEWFFGLRDRAAGNDAKAHLRLALWAVEKGLFSRAQAQVRRAAEIDPKLVKDIQEGKLPEIREGVATRVLESARKDAKEGRLEVAQEKVELLLARMSDTAAGVEAADLLPEVEKQIEEKSARDAEEARGKLAEAERKAQEEGDRLLAPVEETLKKGRALASEGLREDNQPKALEMIGQALGMGESALAKLDGIAKSKADDAALLGRVSELRGRIVAAMVKGYLHRAELYLFRTAVPQAKAEVEKARKIAPEDPAIAAMDDRIDEFVADNDNDIRWYRGDRGDSRSGGRRGGGRR